MSAGQNYIFTSESVAAGHPDKLADQISDRVLDAFLEQDPEARVACESLVKSDLVVLAGEVSSGAEVDYEQLVRDVVVGVGYDDKDVGMDGKTCEVLVRIDEQSRDIAQGLAEGEEREGERLDDKMGAGDQGLMFGFACDETDVYLPASIYYAHQLMQHLDQKRKEGAVSWLRPDAKCQVSVEYDHDRVVRVPCVVLSSQHDPVVSREQVEEFVVEEVIREVIPAQLLHSTQFLVNPTGRFVIGGPQSDAGLTGRKIVVDTYGGRGGHGGGAFSGKDPTKVDRSATYMMRYIAKNIVASGLARRCLIQVAYAIGMSDPVSLWVDDYNTSSVSSAQLTERVREHFSLYPKDIISQLDLKRPIYSQSAVYGHFGRAVFPWEKLDQVAYFRDRQR